MRSVSVVGQWPRWLKPENKEIDLIEALSDVDNSLELTH